MSVFYFCYKIYFRAEVEEGKFFVLTFLIIQSKSYFHGDFNDSVSISHCPLLFTALIMYERK